MILEDFRKTYKSFILLLFGMLLFTTIGVDVALALGISLLFFFVFSIRFLNALLYDSIFDAKGNITEPCVSWKKLIWNKMAVMLIYSIIGNALALIILLLTKQYETLEYIVPCSLTMGADSQSQFVFAVEIMYQIVSGVIPGLNFLSIVLLCSFLSLKNPCKTAWCIFWILDLLIVPSIIRPCLNQILSPLINGAEAEPVYYLLSGALSLFIIIAVLKNHIRQKQYDHIN